MNLLESFQSNQERLSIQQIAFVERKDYMNLFSALWRPFSPPGLPSQQDCSDHDTVHAAVPRLPRPPRHLRADEDVQCGIRGEGGHHAQGHVSSDCPIERGQRSEWRRVLWRNPKNVMTKMRKRKWINLPNKEASREDATLAMLGKFKQKLEKIQDDE